MTAVYPLLPGPAEDEMGSSLSCGKSLGSLLLTSIDDVIRPLFCCVRFKSRMEQSTRQSPQIEGQWVEGDRRPSRSKDVAASIRAETDVENPVDYEAISTSQIHAAKMRFAITAIFERVVHCVNCI